jgi:hypothetical protein
MDRHQDLLLLTSLREGRLHQRCTAEGAWAQLLHAPAALLTDARSVGILAARHCKQDCEQQTRARPVLYARYEQTGIAFGVESI